MKRISMKNINVWVMLICIVTLSGCNVGVDIEGEGNVTFASASEKTVCYEKTCNFDAGFNETVSLTPKANTKYVFIRWQGACGAEPVCILKSNASKSATAIFAPSGYRAEIARVEALVDTLFSTDMYYLDSHFASSQPRVLYDQDAKLRGFPTNLSLSSTFDHRDSSYYYNDSEILGDINFIDAPKDDSCYEFVTGAIYQDSIVPRYDNIVHEFRLKNDDGSIIGFPMTGGPNVYGITSEEFIKGQLNPNIDLSLSKNALLKVRIGEVAENTQYAYNILDDVVAMGLWMCEKKASRFSMRFKPKATYSFEDTKTDINQVLFKLQEELLPEGGFDENAIVNMRFFWDDKIRGEECLAGIVATRCVNTEIATQLTLDINPSGLFSLGIIYNSSVVADANSYHLLEEAGELAKSNYGYEYRIYANSYEGAAKDAPASEPMGIAAGDFNDRKGLKAYFWKPMPKSPETL